MAKHELSDAQMPDATRQKIDAESYVALRAVVTNRQAAMIIGELGTTIASLRSTGVDVDVSDQIRGAIERVLTVSGSAPEVANVFGSVVKVLLGEDPSASGTSESNTLTLRLAMPHVYLGAIIGSGGYRLRQIMEASKTQIYASEFCLPLSSERTLSITGRAEEISSAISEIGKDVLSQKSKAETAMNNPYTPVAMFGRYGHPESFRLTKPLDTMMTPSNPYGIALASFNAPATDHHHSSNENIVLPNDPRAGASRGPIAGGASGTSGTKDKLTQQIYIPNDMVGAIIGKSGSKINEIRQLSGSHIKINEPDATRTSERLITVEGSQEQNQLALYMLYQRLESEKRRQ